MFIVFSHDATTPAIYTLSLHDALPIWFRGVSPEYFDIKRWYVDQGAAFSQDDVDRAADVCAIGLTVRDQLFGVEDPIGKVIRVKDLPCKVVATLHPKDRKSVV